MFLAGMKFRFPVKNSVRNSNIFLPWAAQRLAGVRRKKGWRLCRLDGFADGSFVTVTALPWGISTTISISGNDLDLGNELMIRVL